MAESSAAPDAAAIARSAGDLFQPQLDPQSTVKIDAIAPDPQYVSTIVPTAPDPQFGLPAIASVPEILIANPGTPTTARDPANVTGVGQMVVNNGGGSVGLCTATLINPRTVIFAAHCVNSRAAGAYGANTGGTPIAFGFETNTRANAAGQPDELLNWFNGASTGPGVNQTNVAQAFYNSRYVSYNPQSTEPNARSFLYADIATATLDTPAANVPTWALLFSQLPAVPITANGTGYHVTIDGYGANGTGTSGSGGIDFRRRIAENTLGALASLGDFEQFLFGAGGTSDATNPQNLYWIDFDDPRRGTAAASPFDFNAWRDNALPNEGTTAGGDSGGPLILDRQFAKSVVLGVLSGGYTRFFNGQPANGYGTASFYQPLYLYWDWIAANNPYHYVGSIAGNGDWTDPAHWVTNLDPNYQIIVNGQLINGIPTSPGAGNTDQPGFGQACFESGGVSDCLDVASGTETVVAKPIGTAANDAGQAQTGELTEAVAEASVQTGVASASRPTGGTLEAQASALVLPAPTLASGLPGATNFVPNNFDGDRVARVNPRYFDVTLAAAGTTTLGSTVVIDRFTMANAGAALNIGTTGSLTSLISITQMTGTMSVNGTLTSPGDYFMLAGGLNGTGLITTPFFTSAAGTISPGALGTAGSVGTLTFKGNTIFASGSTLLIDIGAAGTNDKVVVQTGAAGSGIANVGGAVLFNVISGTMPRAGDIYTFLTAQNAVTGTFGGSAALSAILRPTLIYSPTAVAVQITAVPYASVVDPNSAVQVSYAALMDGSRVSSANGALSALFGPLDLQNQATIRAFFESAAPRTETLRTALGNVGSDASDRFFRQRIHGIDPGSATGHLALIGQPVYLANRSNQMRASSPLDAGLGFAESERPGGNLPDDMSAYLAAGYLNGSSAPMPAAASGGRDTFNGWFVAGGVEKAIGEHATLGVGMSYSDVKGDTGGFVEHAGSRLVQFNFYTSVGNGKGLVFDARLGLGHQTSDSSRTVTLLTTPYTLALKDQGMVISGELGMGVDVANKSGLSIVPRVSLRYGDVGFGGATETGGPMALTIERSNIEALESRVGLSVSAKQGSRIRPYFEANYVHDFLDQPAGFSARFTGGTAYAPFALAPTDNDWGEVSGGIAVSLGARAEMALEADTTVFRDDIRNQSYRAKISFRF
ncbi:MAG: autotransporter domain-containing protein [Pseudomonadota bacterium]|nr:autotransporter domain-containing protein [Pseudomonadota bacterium]